MQTLSHLVTFIPESITGLSVSEESMSRAEFPPTQMIQMATGPLLGAIVEVCLPASLFFLLQ